MRKLIPGERFVDVPSSETRERLAVLSPYLRQSGDHWRTPWVMERRKLLDYLLVYIAGGEGVFSVGEETFEVSARDLIWIPPNTIHEMRGTSDLMNCVYLHFDLLYDPERSHWDACIPGGTCNLDEFAELMHPPLQDSVIASWQGKIKLPRHQVVMQLMKQICLEHRRSGAGYSPLLFQGMILHLISELLSQYLPSTKQHPYREVMQEAAGEIVDSASSTVNIARIADKYQLSTSHFRRLFKEVHHQSPGAMHQKAKISLACEKLVYTNMTLAEIADDLGYNNVHNFSRAFKKRILISPGAYRRSGPLVA